MTLRRASLAACVLLLPLAATAAQMKPGKWQITTSTERPGLPYPMPPVSFTHCYTKEDVAKTEGIPTKSAEQKNCKVSDIKRVGDTITWKVACSGRHPLAGTGSMTIGSESYTAVTKYKMPNRQMTQRSSGKRVGNCDQ